MQFPCRLHRRDNIISSLHDDRRNMANLFGVANQLIFRRKESAVDKIVAFNSREGQGEFGAGEIPFALVVLHQRQSRAFP